MAHFNPHLRLTKLCESPWIAAMRYQRSQVIPALWTVFAGPFAAIHTVPMKSIPKPFVRRVANLLDKGIGVTPEIERDARASSRNTASKTQ